MSSPDGKTKQRQLLPLVNESVEKISKDDLVSFTLNTTPGTTGGADVKYSMRILKGTEDIRTGMTWMRNMEHVFKGLGLTANNATTGKGQDAIVQQTTKGNFLSLYNTNHAAKCAAAQVLEAEAAKQRSKANGETDVQADAAHAAEMAKDCKEFCSPDTVKAAYRAALELSWPSKALQRVKRYLRRHCRKPADMGVKEFANHLKWQPSLSFAIVLPCYFSTALHSWLVSNLSGRTLDSSNPFTSVILDVAQSREAIES